jgi:hypothetical protein
MELMRTSLDKLYKCVYSVPDRRIPENVLGKLTRAVSYGKCYNLE